MGEKRIIILDFNGEVKRVYLDDYINAKLKSLRDFGYISLTESEVREQADKVLAGIKGISKDGLSIIGMTMENEITPEAHDG